jgi:hypothetical protein
MVSSSNVFEVPITRMNFGITSITTEEQDAGDSRARHLILLPATENSLKAPLTKMPRGAQSESALGQGLPLRLRWQYVRCTPDC